MTETDLPGDDIATVLPMKIADADAVAALFAAAPETGAGWTAAAIGELLGGVGFGVIATTDSGDCLGAALATRIDAETELVNLAVAEKRRRSGLGQALMRVLLADARTTGAGVMFLEVAEDNRPAQALYRKSGFETVGRRREYYRRGDGGVDALVMSRNL